MRKGFLIYEEMRKYFLIYIYEEAVSHAWLCNVSILNFLIYEENLIFFFISACMYASAGVITSTWLNVCKNTVLEYSSFPGKTSKWLHLTVPVLPFTSFPAYQSQNQAVLGLFISLTKSRCLILNDSVLEGNFQFDEDPDRILPFNLMQIRIRILPLAFFRFGPSHAPKWPSKTSIFSLWCGCESESSFPKWFGSTLGEPAPIIVSDKGEYHSTMTNSKGTSSPSFC